MKLEQKQLPLYTWQIEITCFGETIAVNNDNAYETKLAIGQRARALNTKEAWQAASKACQVIVAMELEYALIASADKEDAQVVATNIRPMRWPQDAEAALWIEQSAFLNPMGSDGFKAILQETHSLVLVAEIAKGCVAGYMHMTAHESGWELRSVAVDSHFRRLGVGRAMVEYAKTRKLSQRRSHLFCTVREENLQAQLFCRAVGLRCMTIIKHYYNDSDNPAYFFRYIRHF
jgi:ribosomal protein S18 acetylase RimI-like enzyme